MLTREEVMDSGVRMCVEERFLSKVSKASTGCWEYLGGKDQYGYGRFAVGKRRLGAHKVAYTLFKGDVPDDVVVMHSCDNPACVIPEHLSLGTVKDNVRDCIDKGRFHYNGGNRASVGVIAEKDGSGMYFPRVRDACAEGFSQGMISEAARGTRKSYRGYQWQYLTTF